MGNVLGDVRAVFVEQRLAGRHGFFVGLLHDVTHNACVVHGLEGDVIELFYLGYAVMEHALQRLVDVAEPQQADDDDHDEQCDQRAKAPGEAG
jgi:hypothetical protein